MSEVELIEGYMSGWDAARVFQTSKQSLALWRQKGLKSRKIGNAFYYKAADIVSFIKAQREEVRQGRPVGQNVPLHGKGFA